VHLIEQDEAERNRIGKAFFHTKTRSHRRPCEGRGRAGSQVQGFKQAPAYAGATAFLNIPKSRAPCIARSLPTSSAIKMRDSWASAFDPILLKKSDLAASILAAGGRRATVAAFSGCCCDRDREQLGKFTEVLGCCCKVELVFCSVGTSKTQAVEFQDSFEVREQHLDLLSLAM